MATVEFSLDSSKYKFADLYGNQLEINLKRLIGLKITLVKFTYPKAWTGLGVSFSVLLFGNATM